MDSSADQFLRNATSGFNRWWVWIVGIVSIVVIWMGIGAIPSLASCEFVKSANLVDFTCDDSINRRRLNIACFCSEYVRLRISHDWHLDSREAAT